MTATTETYEQRHARIQAQEQAEREHRTTLLPIDPNTLTVTFGRDEGDDLNSAACGRCGIRWDDDLVFGVTIDRQAGNICLGCLAAAGEDSYPAALGQLIQALHDVCNALGSVPPETRPDLYDVARQALEWLDDSDEPTDTHR